MQRIQQSYLYDSTFLSLSFLIRSRRLANWSTRNNLLWTEGRVYIGSSESLQTLLIQSAHIDPETNYHATPETTHYRLDHICYWPESAVDVETVINRCGCRAEFEPVTPIDIPPVTPIGIPPVPPIPAQYLNGNTATTTNQ